MKPCKLVEEISTTAAIRFFFSLSLSFFAPGYCTYAGRIRARQITGAGCMGTSPLFKRFRRNPYVFFYFSPKASVTAQQLLMRELCKTIYAADRHYSWVNETRTPPAAFSSFVHWAVSNWGEVNSRCGACVEAIRYDEIVLESSLYSKCSMAPTPPYTEHIIPAFNHASHITKPITCTGDFVITKLCVLRPNLWRVSNC